MQPGIVALLFLAAAPATLPHAPLRLEMANCEELDGAAVTRVVGMELGASLAGGGDVATKVRVECQADEARVTISDPVSGKSSTRVLDLREQRSDMRSRLLGMAITEAVLASWIEDELTPAPAKLEVRSETRRAASDVASDHLPVASRESLVAQDEITAGPVARRFGSGLVVGGLGVGVVKWWRPAPRFGVAFDVDGDYGGRSTAHVGWASATSLSLASRLVVRATVGSLLATVGVGWRGALVRFVGEPADSLRAGRTATAAWTGPTLTVHLSLALSRALFIRAGIEGGSVLAPVRGTVNGVQAIAFDGAWLGGEISLGMKL